RRLDRVKPSAVVPEDLAPLLIAERQTQELLDRLGESAVRVRVVAGDDEILRAELVDRVYRRLFVDVQRDVALTLEIFARRHRQLHLAARTELLPVVVQAPQPPVQPSGRAFEKCAAQLRM